MTSRFNYFQDRWKGVKLKDGELYIYSSYYDDRPRAHSAKEGNEPVIRINVIAPKSFKTKHGNTLCLVKLKNGNFVAVKVSVIQLLEHFNLKWASYFVNCQLSQEFRGKLYDQHGVVQHGILIRLDNKNISAVTLTDQEHLKDFTNFSKSELKIQKVVTPIFIDNNTQTEMDKAPSSFALCVKPVYGHWYRAIWLVEFLEMYRLLGKIT